MPQKRLYRSRGETGRSVEEQRIQRTKNDRRIISISPQDTTASLHTQQPFTHNKRTIKLYGAKDEESKTTIKLNTQRSHSPKKALPSRKEIREELHTLKRNQLRRKNPELEYQFIGKICKVSNVRNYANSELYRVEAARRKTTRELVAIKILPLKGFFERTLEGEIYTRNVVKAQYPSLPHIIKAHEIFAFQEKLYLVMEFLPLPLNKFERLFLSQFNSLLPQVIVAKAMRDLLIALNTLHTFGFVHCDIKPGNVLVSTNLEFKLTDFGQCYRMSKGFLDHVHGTDGYTSQDKQYTTKEDIYSVGRLTLFLLVGAERWFDYYKMHSELHSFLMLDGISDQAKQFVQMCVSKKRPSAQDLLLHNEFIQLAETKDPEYLEIEEDLKKRMVAVQRF